MHVALPGCTKAECCLIEVVVDAYGERDLRPADSTALVVSVPAVARRRAYLGHGQVLTTGYHIARPKRRD